MTAAERGSGTILALALMMVIMVVGLALLAAVQVVTARARAVTAADAAALAAAPLTFPALTGGERPEEAAFVAAAANGSRLLVCSCPILETFDPRSVQVEVETTTRVVIVGEVKVRASSRAEYVP